MIPERRDWTRALTAHPKHVLLSLADRLTADCQITHVNLPRAGLGLMALRDGAFHEPFYLGEFPLSTCRVELSCRDGRKAEGGAQVMADDVELTRALAILDAVLAARMTRWEEVQELVATGVARREEQDRRRRAMLAATKVDFSLLADANEIGDAS